MPAGESNMKLRDRFLRYGVWPALMLFATVGRGWCHAQQTAPLPVAITACGQAADAVTVSQLSSRLHVDHVFAKTLTAEGLQGIKTLVIVIGGSVSGLGGPNTDENHELSRIMALIARAKHLAVEVIAVHIGGESRRGASSDKLIQAVIDRADYLIVTEAGNRDGLFTRAARANTVPLVIVDEPVDVGRELKAVLSNQ